MDKRGKKHCMTRRSMGKTVLLSSLLFWPQLAGAEEKRNKPALQLKKRSKESVQYQDMPFEGRTCAKCMLYAGNGVCVILEAAVSPNGWCNQWVPPTLG